MPSCSVSSRTVARSWTSILEVPAVDLDICHSLTILEHPLDGPPSGSLPQSRDMEGLKLQQL